MTTLVAAPAERAAYLAVGDGEVFALLAEPTGPARGIGVLVLPGGIRAGTAGRNALWTRLARRLAADGYHVVRPDWHGVGESTGESRAFLLTHPFTDVVLASVALLEARGVRDVVVVGTCFGSRTALACAPQITGLAAALLFTPPVHDCLPTDIVTNIPTTEFAKRAVSGRVLRKALNPRQAWRYGKVVARKVHREVTRRLGARERQDEDQIASRNFLDPLEALCARGLPTLIVYGDEDPHWHRFGRARPGRLGRIVDGAGDHVAVRTVPGHFHNLASAEAQDHLLTTVDAFLAEQFGPRPTPTS